MWQARVSKSHYAWPLKLDHELRCILEQFTKHAEGQFVVKNRRRHTAAYKFRIALEAVEGSKTISQLSSEHEIHANLIRAWNRQLLEGGPRVFASNGEHKQQEQAVQLAELFEQIGRCPYLHLLPDMKVRESNGVRLARHLGTLRLELAPEL